MENHPKNENSPASVLPKEPVPPSLAAYNTADGSNLSTLQFNRVLGVHFHTQKLHTELCLIDFVPQNRSTNKDQMKVFKKGAI